MGLRLLLVIAAIVTLLVLDALRPPADQWMGRLAIGAIHTYQRVGSPIVARTGIRCRFTPSCSHYGAQVIEKYGIARGSWLSARRIVRCRPGTPMGTVDYP